MVLVKKSSQTNKTAPRGNKESSIVEASKPNQPERALIPKSKIPPSVANFDEVAQDPLKHILEFTNRRLKNLQTRRDKLHGYQKLIKKGEEVDKKKREALKKYNEVLGNITLAEEFSKLFTFLTIEVGKAKQRLLKDEEERRKKKETNKSRFIARCLFLLNLFATNQKIQEDFLEGKNNAVKLSQKEINLLLKFSQLCLVRSHKPGDNVVNKAEKCGEHLNLLFNSSPTKICDSTYASVRTVYDRMCRCEYYKALPDLNPIIEIEEPEEEEEQEEEPTSNTANVEPETIETLEEVGETEDYEFTPQIEEESSTSPVAVQQREIVPPAATQATKGYNYSMPESQPDPPAAFSKSAFEELQAVIGNVGDPHLQQIQMSFQVEEQPVDPPVSEEKPPAIHTIEEVLAEVQGQYNFLQDSVIDVDNAEGGSGAALQLSAGVSDSMAGSNPTAGGMMPNQYNPVSDRTIEKESGSFLPNGPTMISNEVSTSHLHHTSASNSLYYVPADKSDKYAVAEPKLLAGQEGQLKQAADNLGMGQTTFGANDPNYVAEKSQYSGTALRSVDAFQQQPSDIAIMKTLPDNNFASTPFSSLHGNSQSPFEGGLSANEIPGPIPLPTNASSLSQTLSAAEPPTTHIPFPNDKMSGYHGYSTSGPNMDNTAGMGQQAEERNEQFTSLQEKQHQTTLLSAGDAVHIPPPVLKLDSGSVDGTAKDPVATTEESNEMASNSAAIEDKPLPPQGHTAANRNTRAPAPYQNNAPPNYNRGNNGMPRQVSGPQGQAMGGFYQNRSGNYRPHSRNYGNFDSMGHPKHFGGPGGGYQHPQGGAGIPTPFPPHYNRQDNGGIYGGGAQRRGPGGSGRANRGYPARMNNMRNGAPSNNYNRSRTFRPQNSDQVA